MSIWTEIRNDVNGAAILNDWLGDGMHPVSQEQADHRSLACVSADEGKPCPHNRESQWWEKSKGIIAGMILEQLSIKSKLKMTTPLESHLNMCAKCGCCLPLKIHVPIEFIKSHTAPDTISSYPPFCWQRIELENNP